MSVQIIGELTADNQSIILMDGGSAHPDALGQAQAKLKTLTPKVDAKNGWLQLPASWPAVIQLAHLFGQDWRPQDRLQAWIAEQVSARVQDPGQGQLMTVPPAGLTPRSYQVDGARLIATQGSALIFDEPRTGKTITAILGLVERHLVHHDNPVTPILVVCPASVVDPWVEHFRRWAPQWRTVAWRGTPNARRRLVGTADVYVTSYDTCRRDAPAIDQNNRAKPRPLIELGARSLVIDECHKIKNQQTQQSLAVRRLATGQHVIALSGTPITHHPGDLWPTLRAMDPTAWPSRERFISRYCLVLPTDYGDKVLGLNPATEPEFRTCLMGQHRRIRRADVIEEMPKVYSIRTVTLPEPWRRTYDEMQQQMLTELPDGGELVAFNVLAKLTRLQQLSSAAANITWHEKLSTDKTTGLTYTEDAFDITLKAPSWKVDALLEVLDERPDDLVVAFAPSRQLMTLAGAAAEKAGRRVGYIWGKQTPAERTETIAQFQAGKIDLVCATTSAGGTGITLSAADTLVFLQRPWSLVDSIQAEDRAEGVLKDKGTEIIDIIASNTIDTRIRAVLHERAGALSELLKDPSIVAQLLGGASITELKRRKAS